MRCLWLTWIDPAPEHDGQRIYSGRLIDAVTAAGARLDILCFSNGVTERPRQRDQGARWHLVPHEERPGWRSVFSRLPNLAYRCDTRGARRALGRLLEESWDVVVFEGLSAGWALDAVKRRYPRAERRPRLIHISHNHEETTRRLVARNFSGNPLKAALLRVDAQKAAHLEQRMIETVDLVTAITADDAGLYRRRNLRKPIQILSPGYGGKKVPARRIDNSVPRRALLVGSFEWLAKQMNLREFVAVADPIFAAAGCELRIVGNGEETFFQSLRPSLKATEIVGPVDDIAPYFDEARIAVIPERSGGGFKLKLLDYVFNRLPIAALDNAIAGVPLISGESILTFADHEALARGMVQAMDDFEFLNRVQNRAFAACEHAFDWSLRGQSLVAAMTATPTDKQDERPKLELAVAAVRS